METKNKKQKTKIGCGNSFFVHGDEYHCGTDTIMLCSKCSKEKEILQMLKLKGRLPKTRLAASVGLNTESIEPYLIELEKNNKVTKSVETVATYYKLKEIKK